MFTTSRCCARSFRAGVSSVATDDGIAAARTERRNAVYGGGWSDLCRSIEAAGYRFSIGFARLLQDLRHTGLEGRAFNDQDTASSVRVAMVNEEFDARYLNVGPVATAGVDRGDHSGIAEVRSCGRWQIVGVFHNLRYGEYRDAYPEVDVPFAQSLSPDVTIRGCTAEIPRR